MKYRLFVLRTFFISISFASVTAQVAAQATNSTDTSSIPRFTQSAIRLNRSPVRNDQVFIVSDPGQEGMFKPDPSDRSTPDDSAMTLVSGSGMRFKRVIDGRSLNARWFGARGNGSTDDWPALQKAINYILANDHAPRTLFLPAGGYRISRPLLIARFTGTGYLQSSINLEGPANSKDLSTGGATIAPTFNNTFAIGIQLGKGVAIKDLFIRGAFYFPDRLNAIQIDTLSFAEWTDGSTRDNRITPYSGIVIDPFCDPGAFSSEKDIYPGLRNYYVPGLNRSGSTAVQITGCSITNFVVGVMITPSNQQNGELIDVIDCDISSNKVAYAMSQAQSKECHVDRLKVWGATHTVFDNVSYGLPHGDGAGIPMVDGANIAGNVKQLCNIMAPSFSGVFRNIYGEGIFRLGYVGGAASVSFEDCQLDFATQNPGLPYPDFYVAGSGASFHGCILRTYMDGKGYRLVLAGNSNTFEGGTMNEPPVIANLNDCGLCPMPLFRNIIMYYGGGILGSSNYSVNLTANLPSPLNVFGADPVYYGNTYLAANPYGGTDLLYKFTYNTGYERTIALAGNPVLHVDLANWTGWFKLTYPTEAALLLKDDIILTSGLHYHGEYSWIQGTTNPVGFIQRIGHDTVYLRNLACGIHNGMSLPLWSDYYVMAYGPFTGDISSGSNTITHVQGRFPRIGERLDIPMLPNGSYVTAVDNNAKSIQFSMANTSSRSFADYTFINGYPTVDMHSCYDLPTLIKNGKSLIGGAHFYLHDLIDRKLHEPSYLLGANTIAEFRNDNTNLNGDTTWHPLRYERFPPATRPITQ